MFNGFISSSQLLTNSRVNISTANTTLLPSALVVVVSGSISLQITPWMWGETVHVSQTSHKKTGKVILAHQVWLHPPTITFKNTIAVTMLKNNRLVQSVPMEYIQSQKNTVCWYNLHYQLAGCIWIFFVCLSEKAYFVLRGRCGGRGVHWWGIMVYKISAKFIYKNSIFKRNYIILFFYLHHVNAFW